MNPQELLARIEDRKLPPVHEWHPTLCGDIDIRIARDGTWFHEGSPVRRQRMVNLFATILRKDADGEFYLVTPVEKLRIQVEDAPFVAVDFDAAGHDTDQVVVFTTNAGDRVAADADHPIRVEEDPATKEPAPYVMVRDGLEALINRSTFYRLVELARERNGVYGIWSGGEFFALHAHR